MKRSVSYSKKMRESATREKKFLVTVEVYGRHIKDDSACVQCAVSHTKAKELTRIALGLLGGEK